jgi:hypothetical protein
MISSFADRLRRSIKWIIQPLRELGETGEVEILIIQPQRELNSAYT